jgi:hypothetical protein
MRYEGQTRNEGLKLAPDKGEADLEVGISACHTVYSGAVGRVEVGNRADKAVFTSHNPTITHNDNTH